ncbi:MAG: capsular biosynthesis protein, partial [Novosphingobium sp.]
MTKHSKIRIPKTKGEEVETAAPKPDSGTLIERVVRNYDLVQLSSPPIPENLIPPVSKRRRYSRASDLVEDAVVIPVAPMSRDVPQDLPQDAPQPAPVAQPRPEVIEPDVVVAAMPAPEPRSATALAPLPEAVRFKGPSLPVNRHHLREQGLIVPEGTVTGLLEEFRIVKRQLLLQASQLAQQGMGAEAQRVLVCSPHSGEGKTYTSLNLALAIAAEKETEVLLVDADFAKPSVLSSLGLAGGPGLMDALADPTLDVIDCVIGTDIPGLWVLPAGNATTSDSEY